MHLVSPRVLEVLAALVTRVHLLLVCGEVITVLLTRLRDDAAHRTLLVVLVEVHLAKVSLHRGLLREELATEFTIEGLLTVVYAHVAGKVTGLGEPLPALLAPDSDSNKG